MSEDEKHEQNLERFARIEARIKFLERLVWGLYGFGGAFIIALVMR